MHKQQPTRQHHENAKNSLLSDLRKSIQQEVKNPWGKANCYVGVVLLFVLIVNLIVTVLFAAGIRLHWKIITIAISLHDPGSVIVSIILLVLTVAYWMFCINTFKELQA